MGNESPHPNISVDAKQSLQLNRNQVSQPSHLQQKIRPPFTQPLQSIRIRSPGMEMPPPSPSAHFSVRSPMRSPIYQRMGFPPQQQQPQQRGPHPSNDPYSNSPMTPDPYAHSPSTPRPNTEADPMGGPPNKPMGGMPTNVAKLPDVLSPTVPTETRQQLRDLLQRQQINKKREDSMSSSGMEPQIPTPQGPRPWGKGKILMQYYAD